MTTYWLLSDAGVRVPVRVDGVVIGRGQRSDVIVEDDQVSRAHAIVYANGDGVSLVMLGSGQVAVNGRDVAGAGVQLRAGDRVTLAAAGFVVVGEPAAEAPARSAWMLRDGAGALFGVTRTPFAIGDGPDTDLRIAGWPPLAALLHLGDALHVEAVAAVTLGGAALAPGDVEVARVGDVLAHTGEALTVVAGGPNLAAVTTRPHGVPDHVTVEFLPRGGRLTLGWGERTATVYLPERRCELVAVLAEARGELVADEQMLARLWPGQTRSRVDLNVVIHRARSDLLRGGLDGALIERVIGGTATRLAVGPATQVQVK